MDHDVIVVGTRAAGAATAMLLARAGLRVLAVDRARFPSDTLSTHQVQVPGIARLGRWGVLDRIAAVTPAVPRVRLDVGAAVLDGRYPAVDGVDALYGPRRTLLDATLVDGARAAGAEVREGFAVDELTRDAEGRVTGIQGRNRGEGRGRGPSTVPITATARLVIGADGKRSTIAEAVGAGAYHVRPPATFACYTYWSGVDLPVGSIYVRPGLTVPAFPTNDGLVMVAVFAPLAEFDRFRADPAAGYLAALDRCGDLGERVRSGVRAEPYRLAPDVPNLFRAAHGPGWALVGDAGIVMDPVAGQGISNAFRDAESLAAAVARGMDAGGRLDEALAGYQRERDAAAWPVFAMTRDLAGLRISTGQRLLLGAIADDPVETSQFLGVLAGAVRYDEYLRAGNVLGRIGGGAVRRLRRVGSPAGVGAAFGCRAKAGPEARDVSAASG
ncbi:NAD(P)/FAD-dependent oxidoreductase [Asanoa siamensis]|uniref:FAD-dependent oxidoreductase n=1 Tax=Asanoa siamensis TaxID=926357 RepID=A0ABQ4CHY3_9ACTN|nr:FAD-dependent monooxygenase [Asanoa siamensis]GIF70907.1 FAD-dependent oxidoreductase [Asanoa siamensis]